MIDLSVLEALVEAGATAAQVVAAVRAMIGSTDSVIYVVTSGDLTKIGITNNADRRLRELGRQVGQPVSLIWKTNCSRDMIYEIELACHAALDEFRVKGEWFKVTPEQAIEAIKSEMAQRGL